MKIRGIRHSYFEFFTAELNLRIILMKLPLAHLLVLLVFLASCSEETPTDNTGNTNTNKYGKIQGYLYTQETSDPIPGATVKLVPGNKTVVTYPDGMFYIDSVLVGSYTMYVDWPETASMTSTITVSQNATAKPKLYMYTPLGSWKVTMSNNTFQYLYLYDDHSFDFGGIKGDGWTNINGKLTMDAPTNHYTADFSVDKMTNGRYTNYQQITLSWTGVRD